MSTPALFFSGLLITIVVVVGIGLLVWGAILDGRYNDEVRERMREETDKGSVRAPRAGQRVEAR